MDTDTEATTVFYGEPNCTCGDMCVVTTGWWRDGCAFHPSDTPIQDAIDNAGTGDTICVKDGMYNENVVVNKQLNLIGIGLPTVDAGGNNSAIEVTADVCLIEGFNVTGSGDDHGDAGICVRSDNNIIKNNIANSNGECGIYLSTSTYSNNVIANTASDNNMGIYLHWSSNYNTITNNTVNSNSYSGIHLLSVDNNKVTANMISYNQYAIHLWGASNNKVTANIIAYNRYGIYLFSDSDNNTITSNTISSNSRCGIHLDDASNINNLIYNNYFNNTKNAYGDGNNIWNSTKTAGTNIIGGPYLGGNYWSDYAGEDLDGDGLGDTLLPYNSSGDITSGGDVLPLIKVAQKSMALISTDKFRYSPGDPMTITISISKPTEDNVTFQWYWVVPQYNVSFPVMSVFTSADYFGTFNLRIPTPGFGLKPPGNLFYVQLLDNTIGEVLDADATCWTCTPSGEVMPPERIVEQINETIERMELP
jgi:parallel beta-helix repeat protein